MYVDRKRMCVICGDSSDEREMRSASATKVQNAILVACLSACGGLKQTVDAKTVYDECHVNRRFLCHPHYVLAAQFIAAEMESVGMQFQHFEDPQASGSTAYVGMSEIPSHIVKFVNDFMSAANINGTVTAKDVCRFMSVALRRYHGTPLWPLKADVPSGSQLTNSINDTASCSLTSMKETDFAATSRPPDLNSDITPYIEYVGGVEGMVNTRPCVIDVEKKQAGCVVCAVQHAAEGFRTSSTSKVQNAIIIASLLASGYCMKMNAKAIYDNCNASRKNMCHRHYVAAAQYIAAEMELAGKPLAHFEDPLSPRSTAYVTAYAIPPKIVKLVNDFMECMNADGFATERDICQFMNGSIRRYHGTPLWPNEQASNSQSRCEEKTPSQLPKKAENSRSLCTDNAQSTSAGPSHSPDNACMPSVKITMGRPIYAVRVSAVPMNTNTNEYQYSQPYISQSSSNGMVPCVRILGEPQLTAVRLLNSSSNHILTNMKDSMSTTTATAINKTPSSIYDVTASYVDSIGETEPTATSKYYLAQGEMLMRLFRFCPECGNKLEQSQLSAVGTAAIVRYVCPSCSRHAPMVKHWICQRHFVQHNREKSFNGNVTASVAAITTGFRYIELQRWATLLNLSFFRQAFFWKVFEWTKRNIPDVYHAQQGQWLKIVRLFYEKGEGLQLAVDTARNAHYNHRRAGKAVFSDTRTKLVLHCESAINYANGERDARTAIKHFIQRLSKEKLPVSSLITRHFTSLDTLSDGMEAEYGHVRRLSSRNELIRWLEAELRKAARELGCGSICLWIEHTKKHLSTAIEVGNRTGLDIPAFFNTCLMHVRGVHEWPVEEITGMHTRCAHPPLTDVRSEPYLLRGYAYHRFRDVILDRFFQKSLESATSRTGVSIRQLKSTFNKIYRRKKIQYPSSMRALYTTMSILHMNERRLTKLADQLAADAKRQRKERNNSRATLEPFTYNKWKDEIFETDLKSRLKMLEMKWDEPSSQEALEMMKVDEEYEIGL